MAGATALLGAARTSWAEVKVIAAPCVGVASRRRWRRAPEAGAQCHAGRVQRTVQAQQASSRPAGYLESRLSRAGGYTLLLDCMEQRRDIEAVLKTMEDSGLRGLGGAGFPTGRKWRIVRGEPAPRLHGGQHR